MAAVFNSRSSFILEVKISPPAPQDGSSPLSRHNPHRDSQLVRGVTISDSTADEFSGSALSDTVGTRDLATLASLTENTIIDELEKRYEFIQ